MRVIFLEQIFRETTEVISELVERGHLCSGQLLVVGCSTSEVVGEQIGKAGVPEVAEQICSAVRSISQQVGFFPVFQCCEHLNRALVLERAVAERCGYEEVSVVPVPTAGGSLASTAYRTLDSACVVEQVRAHAAIDIGETLIGMHLRQVAVPFRPTRRMIGMARVTAAFTRPKLIGGARAVYS